MNRPLPFRLFERFGVELEYMIVDARTLAVLPVTDRVLHAVAGEYVSDVELGAVSWSNELALHVIELKTTDPAARLDGLAAEFQEHVVRINRLLEPLGGRLMPTAMHPWMDPHREMRLWPHDYSPVYEAFDRVFDCRGHGWANLQSVHLNLPFADDAQFARLHAAIRLLLPIMPALAASSPVMDGRATGRLDNRLEVYRHNARRVPRVSGAVIPEPVFSRQAYEQEILQPLYRDIAPLDPDGTLQFEWLNARGAIARFDRNTIEIRVLDVQECPRADLAVCRLLTDVLRAMCVQRSDSQRPAAPVAQPGSCGSICTINCVRKLPSRRTWMPRCKRCSTRALWRPASCETWTAISRRRCPDVTVRCATACAKTACSSVMDELQTVARSA
jgi:glutamate---cysteine ligase / carboxylate-amine ligase